MTATKSEIIAKNTIDDFKRINDQNLFESSRSGHITRPLLLTHPH